MLSSGYGIFDLALYSLGKEMVEGIIKKNNSSQFPLLDRWFVNF